MIRLPSHTVIAEDKDSWGLSRRAEGGGGRGVRKVGKFSPTPRNLSKNCKISKRGK